MVNHVGEMIAKKLCMKVNMDYLSIFFSFFLWFLYIVLSYYFWFFLSFLSLTLIVWLTTNSNCHDFVLIYSRIVHCPSDICCCDSELCPSTWACIWRKCLLWCSGRCSIMSVKWIHCLFLWVWVFVISMRVIVDFKSSTTAYHTDHSPELQDVISGLS